jgi:transcriptional regulator with XRE-family HTH domain
MKNDIQKKFGLKIKEQRIKLHLTQEELAFKANLHRTYIGMVERGEKNISLKNIEKISKALNIQMDVLLRGL